MRIDVAQPIAAPPDAVFARVADFGALEARARRRGLPLERLSDDPPAWRVGVSWHGITRSVDLRIEPHDGRQAFGVAAATRGVDGGAVVDVAATGEGSLLSVGIDLQPHGMAGRMLLRTLDLARPVLETRLRAALTRIAAEIEVDAGDGEVGRPR